MNIKMKLSDCCNFQEGYVNPSQTDKDFFGGKIKWLRASDLNGGYIYNTERTLSQKGFDSAGKSATLFQPNTLAISKSGSIGHLGILKDFMCGNRAVINISPILDKADLKYIFYTLKYNKTRLIASAGGSIQKNLYISVLETLELNHSILAEQARIAAVLSALDDKIELNNKINTELEQMAKTLYDYWFVQFDFPNDEGKPYKSSGGEMVWNNKLQKKIPATWDVMNLGRIVECNKWNLGKIKDEKTINYLDTTNLTKNVLGSYQVLNSLVDKVPSRAQRIVQHDDILYSTVRPEQQHYGIIKEPVRNLIASTGFAQIRSTKAHISNDLLFSFLTQDYLTLRLQTIAQGSVSAYPSISPNDILNLDIVLPKQNDFLKSANLFFKTTNLKISINHKQNQELASLRDWLLPMLMNGQVRVGESDGEGLGLVAEERGE